MERKSQKTLKEWFEQHDRRPLIIRGARQVGKTWLVRTLAKAHGAGLVELNFERNPELKSFFRDNNPKVVLQGLEQFIGNAIDADRDVLFLDEIQAAPELLAKLRWFAEELPTLRVIAAGSLLDFALKEHSFSMPVGRIGYHYLEPMSFEEFLLALGEKQLNQALASLDLQQHLPSPIHEKLMQHFKVYRFVGGMPASVASFAKTRSYVSTSQIQHDLLATYRDDFHKYRTRISHDRLDTVMRAVPLLLGKAFKYRQVNPEIPSASLKRSLELLANARVCHLVRATAANGVPLAAEVRTSPFKAIFLDVGLVSAMLGLVLHRQTEARVPLANEGALAEQVVGQLLRTIEPSFREPSLHYWARQQHGSEAEVDYVIAHGGSVIPIEVKAGRTGTLRSLHSFMFRKKRPFAIRINGDQASKVKVDTKTNTGDQIQYQLLSIPFYLIEQLPRLIEKHRESD